MADVKEILVQWDAGQGISAIARSLGYTRPTVRKYVEAAKRAGLVRGAERRREAGWHELAQGVVDQVAAIRPPSAASAEVARTSPTMIRVGRMRSAFLTRARIEMPPAPSTFGRRACSPFARHSGAWNTRLRN